MKIYKVIADSRPEACLLCPLKKIVDYECGRMVQRKNGAWLEGFKAPDNRCLIEIAESEGETWKRN